MSYILKWKVFLICMFYYIFFRRNTVGGLDLGVRAQEIPAHEMGGAPREGWSERPPLLLSGKRYNKNVFF